MNIELTIFTHAEPTKCVMWKLEKRMHEITEGIGISALDVR